jgi:ABC-type transport system involved in multi-copper enzyme maturation permease subunit
MRLFSPVLAKEMIQAAAGRKVMVLKALVLLAILAVFLAMLAAQGSGDFARGTAGRDLFMGLSITSLLAAAVFVPVLTADVVCGEREARTLGLLFLTRLRAWQIVQDKALSRVALMLLLGCAILPFLSAAMLFGGVERAHVAAAAGNFLAMVLLAAGVSLLASTLCRRLLHALAAAFLALFLYLIGVPILLLAADMKGGLLGSGVRGEWVVACLNPVVSMALITDGYSATRDPWLLVSWRVNLAVAAGLYAAAVAVASMMLRRLAWTDDPAVLVQPPAVAGRPLGTRAALRGLFVDAATRRLLARVSLVFFLFYWGAIFLLEMCGARILRSGETYEIGYVLGVGVLGLMTALAAASVFARLRETGVFDLLLTTRLDGPTLVRGAWTGLLRALWPAWLVLLVPVAGQAFVRDEAPILVPLVNLAVYGGFFLALGLFLSLRCRTSARAAGWTLGILMILFLGIPLAAGLAAEVGRNLFEYIFMWSPIYWVVEGVSRRGRYHDFGGYAGWFAVSTVYVLAAAVLTGLMMRRFDDLVGRQPATVGKG